MSKTSLLALSLAAIFAVIIFVQFQTVSGLRRELSATVEENSRLRQDIAGAAEKKSSNTASEPLIPEGSTDEGQPQSVLDLKSEIMRLRGVAARVIRAEAEVAQLRAEAKSHPAPTTATVPEATPTTSSLANYLGDPVEPPPNIEPAYTRDGLQKAIQLAAGNAGVTLKRVEIDTAEFPFLLGVVSEQPADFEKIKTELKKVSDYTYGGGVSSGNSYVFSITPSSKFPPGMNERISRRTMLREQMFFDQLLGKQ